MSKSILIAKKRKLTCDYWSRVLAETDHQTVSCWTTTDAVLCQVWESKPDLLLIEAGFAGGQGFQTARQSIMTHPALRCMMALPAGTTYYQHSLQTDISGYLPEDMDDPGELLRCIDQISQGYRYISEVFRGALRSPSDQQIQLISGLSERRKQVLRLLSKGLTARQIAQELKIAESTVCHHKEELTGLLGLSGVYQLKIFAGSVAYLLG